jgi:SagB-type dehydrogenase family enzyme
MEHFMLFVTSPSLIVRPSGKEMVFIYDFLSKNCAEVSVGALFWLSYFHTEATLEQATSDHAGMTLNGLQDELEGLIDEGFLLVCGSEGHARAIEFKQNWAWDISSALFHFTIENNPFVDSQESTAIQKRKQAAAVSPPLSLLHGDQGEKLPSLGRHMGANMFAIMKERRSNRVSLQKSLYLGQLGDCLYAGLGITGYVKVPLGVLPLGMTPSGGARNPFEAYLIVRSVSDLPSGMYHYSAVEHSLQRIPKNLPNEVASMFANQTWMEDAPVILVLVAMFERSMFKYSDPNAYRVTMIEAGHIGQNIMLAATSMGLSACPTAALAHKELSSLFMVEGITHSPVYAISLSYPGISSDEVSPNEFLESFAA